MMKNNKPGKSAAARLREQAERKVSERAIETGESQTLYELRVHQIELEMQNEELRRAQMELETSHARYFDLYDLAPVGYCTLDNRNLIQEANLKCAAMLDEERRSLSGQSFTRFIFPPDQDVYHKLCKRRFESGEPQVCNLRLKGKNGGVFWVRLAMMLSRSADDDSVSRKVVISDITEIKLLEEVQTYLLQWGTPGTKEIFFESLARYLAENLSMDYVCIDRLSDDSLSAQTIAIYNRGKADTNIVYTLKDTPGGDAVGKTICCYPANVQALFPKDAALQELQAESYIGTTLWSFDGKPIGLIAVIGRRALTNTVQAELLLGLVAARAAGELERTKAEERIRALALFPEQNPMPVMRIDKQGTLLYGNNASDEFQHQWGFRIGNRVPPEWSDLLDRCILEQTTQYKEAVVGERTIEFAIVPLPDVEYVNVYAFDITERKRIDDELSTARVQLQGVVKEQKSRISSTQETLTKETEGRLFAENELSHRQEALEAVYAMATTFDSNIESLIDQILLSAFSILKAPLVAIDEYRNGIMVRSSQLLDGHLSRNDNPLPPCAACLRVLQELHPLQFCGDLGKQFEMNLCFDPTRFRSFTAVPALDHTGTRLGMIRVLDEKPRVFADYEIRFLEIFGRYFAHELSRSKLESRLVRAEELRILGQLTSGVAHEVRNPLNGIMAVMGALSRKFESTLSVGPYVVHMRSQVSRLKLLMEDLLELGRPIREENMREISCEQLVENSIATWLQTIQNARKTLFIKPDDTQGFIIKAEVTRVTQVVINLLENAHQHSPVDTPIIISIHASENGRVNLSIKDRGTGVSSEILPRIFEPFFTTRKGGTGLGLSIVRHIVENHQGTISASNNTDGPGATFEIALPVCIRK